MLLVVAGLALAGPIQAPLMEEMEPMPAVVTEPVHADARVKMVEAGWSRLTARKRTLPTLPLGVPVAGERLRCTVRVQVDAAGSPSHVEPRACDAEIQNATVNAAWAWRFLPFFEEGKPVATETELSAVVIAKEARKNRRRATRG